MSKGWAFNLKITALDQFSTTFSNMGAKMERMGKKAKRLGRDMSIGITAPLALFGRQAIKTQLNLEAMENKMVASLGSFELAKTEIALLRSEADRMGINFLTAADSFSSFSASATRSGITLQQTRDIFTDFAETGVALKMNKETTGRVFKALEQMAGKGVVSMEELKLQLADSLPGAVAIAAKSMDMTVAQFIKMTSQGKILASEFLPKFSKTVKKELGGSFEQASQMAAASLARYENAMLDLQRAAAEGGIMDALIAVTQALSALATRFLSLSPNMQKFIVITLMITAALGPLLFAFGQLMIILPAIAGFFATLGAVGTAFAGGLAAIGGLALWLGHEFKNLVNLAGGLGNALLIVGGIILDMIVSPLRLVSMLIGKITGIQLFKDIGNQSFAADAAARAVSSNSDERQRIASARASIRSNAERDALLNKALAGDKAAIEVVFKNPPAGMRANVSSETDANVTVDQGVSMAGAY